MSTVNDLLQRNILPIPDIAPINLDDVQRERSRTANSRRSCPLRPPTGAPNLLVILIDDVGFGASSAFGGPCQTPAFDKLAAERPGVHALPHDRALLADPRRAAFWAQPPFRRDGRDHRNRDRRARLQFTASRTARRRSRSSCGSTATRRRSSGSVMKCRSGRPIRPARSTDGRQATGFEDFYGFLGGETNQYYPGLPRIQQGRRAAEGSRTGLSPH